MNREVSMSTTNIPPDNPINVYRVNPDYNIGGWVILCLSLTLALIIFIVLWAVAINAQYNTPVNTCFGTYGVQPGVDANALNLCGTGGTSPCVFAKNSIFDAETECNNLQSICNAFTFNFSTSTMKIVNSSATFSSPSWNLFVRQ